MPPLKLIALCALLAVLVGGMGFSLYNMIPTGRARLALLAICLSGLAVGAILLLPS
ncbi:hypothetical protein [Sphingopyxis sp.]|uniref:hypothetical protein n=1 Tax=Sphingopyxis sp. TaxID=1908224 RepID=UPI003BAAA9A3